MSKIEGFDQFDRLMRKLVRVPKPEVDREAAKERKKKGRKKKASKKK